MIINNWKNGFGNDGHTDVLVHSNNIIGGGQSFTDSSNDRAMSTNIAGSPSYTRHSNLQHNLGLSSIEFTHPVATCANCLLKTNGAMDIGEQDFCFDASIFVYSLSAGTYSDNFYIGYFDANKVNPFDNCIILEFDNNDQRVDFIVFNNASAVIHLFNIKAYSGGVWNHFAINRKGSWFYLYVNGKMIESFDNGSVYDMSFIANPYHMIYYSCGDCSVPRKFYVEEWRQSIGINRWSSNFIIPNRFF